MSEILDCFPQLCFLCIFEVEPKLQLLHQIIPTPQKNRFEVAGVEGPTGGDKAIDRLPTDDNEGLSLDVVPRDELDMHLPFLL